MICGDLKVMCLLLGQQAGYIKYPCFMCKWDSRSRSQHWKQNRWTPRTSLEPGCKNMFLKSLVEPKKILLSPLHIKLSIMKQLVKALQNTGNYFKYLWQRFFIRLGQNLKRCFVGPDTRSLIFGEDFLLTNTEIEREAWIAFKRFDINVVINNESYGRFMRIARYFIGN
jgi:hypothetical protein